MEKLSERAGVWGSEIVSSLGRLFRKRQGETTAEATSGRVQDKRGVVVPKPEGIEDDPPYAGPPIADLTQDDVIRELEGLGDSRDTAEQRVQAALVLAGTMDHGQIEAIHSSEKPVTKKFLALRWAAHSIHHGARPQHGPAPSGAPAQKEEHEETHEPQTLVGLIRDTVVETQGMFSGNRGLVFIDLLREIYNTGFSPQSLQKGLKYPDPKIREQITVFLRRAEKLR